MSSTWDMTHVTADQPVSTGGGTAPAADSDCSGALAQSRHSVATARLHAIHMSCAVCLRLTFVFLTGVCIDLEALGNVAAPQAATTRMTSSQNTPDAANEAGSGGRGRARWSALRRGAALKGAGADSKNKFWYSLRFSLSIPRGDTCLVAHCWPYTYSNLQAELDEIELDRQRGKFVRRSRGFTTTRAGNACDMLAVSDFRDPAAVRPVVVISARVHPGETNASWMMRGILSFLTSSDPDAERLRQTFEFRIVPMLNPDGVIQGNYRCNLAGHDLNRRYKNPSANQHPTIHALKGLLRSLQESGRTIFMYCDLHGHSIKRNVFLYGCLNQPLKSTTGPNQPPNQPLCRARPDIASDVTAPLLSPLKPSPGRPPARATPEGGAQEESGGAGCFQGACEVSHPKLALVFPYLLQQRNAAFSLPDCRFVVRKAKESTSRVVAFKVAFGRFAAFYPETSHACIRAYTCVTTAPHSLLLSRSLASLYPTRWKPPSWARAPVQQPTLTSAHRIWRIWDMIGAGRS